jgi:tRNA-specific 2-thiouridylase
VGEPVYVVRKDAATNTVTVGPREALLSEGCMAADCNWLVEPRAEWTRCLAKIRYNSEPVPAEVRAVPGAGAQPDMEVRFDAAQPAVAPGQAVVCFEGDRVLCGGWIQ